jgi:uncharacterized protein
VRSEIAELRSADGVRLAARIWASETPEHGGSVVVAHGLTVTKDHWSVVALADRMAAEGFTVVAFDGRGHGGSDGLCTLGTDEALDVAAAVAFAGALSPPVVAVGSSMGAIAVLRFAATGGVVDGVVAVSSPARWRLHGWQTLVAAGVTRTGLGRRLLSRRKDVRLAARWSAPAAPEEMAARIRCPAVIVHGTRDRFIPAGEAVRLYHRLSGPRRLELVDGMGHGFGPQAVGPILAGVRWALTSPAATTPAPPGQAQCEPPSPG